MTTQAGPKVFDTTLRDGEQMPGLAFSTEDKVAIARKLDELGVDVIEAGFPINSKEEMEAIRRVTEEVSATVCAIGRVKLPDLQAAVEAKVGMIDVISSTSDIQMKNSQHMTRDEVLAASQDAVRFIKDAGLICMFTPMDATRTDPGFLLEVCGLAKEAGADWIGLTDTVGVGSPESIAEMVSQVTKLGVPVSIHCHDDFGLATANTVAGVRAGASMFQGCINGLGERAGNASLEEVIMVLKSLYNVDCGIKTEKLVAASRLVERLSGIGVAPNKPVVGSNAFTHESGIHAAGVVKHHGTFEPGLMTPEMVGHARRMVIGKHTGVHGIEQGLKEAGVDPSREELKDIVRRVRAVVAKGKQITNADLYAMAETVMQKMPEGMRPLVLQSVVATTGDKINPVASVQAKVHGEERVESAVGVGPVDAAFKAVKRMLGDLAKVEITRYHVDAITGGSHATVRVSVSVEDETGLKSSASAAHADIVVASVDALFTAANHMLRIKANGDSKQKGGSDNADPA